MIKTSPSPDLSHFRVHLHLKARILEIHFLFDDHGMMENFPKEIEWQKRDKSAIVYSVHECLSIDS